MAKRKSLINKCPLCNSHYLGRLSHKIYYCPDCNHELSLEANNVRVLYIFSDGTAGLVRELKYSI